MIDIFNVELFLYIWFTVLFFINVLGGSSLAVRMVGVRRYDRLSKPSWAPPAWAYGIVWFAVSTLLAFACYRVRLLGAFVGGVNQFQLILFWVLVAWLALYTLAYVVNLWLAAIHVFIAWALAIAVTIFFWQVDTAAGVAMLFALLWITFALVLAVVIAIRNSGDIASKMARDQATHAGRMEAGTRTRPRRGASPAPARRQQATTSSGTGGVRVVR